MKPRQNDIVSLLLVKGRYMRKSQSYPGSFTIYEGNQIPLRRVEIKAHILLLLKVDKKQRYTLNLSEIRQLHGNTAIHKMYRKQSKK